VQNAATTNVQSMMAPTDPLVGKTFAIGHRNVRVDSKISEGGYALVYRVTDLNTLTVHELKSIFVPTPQAKV
jgi:hypothetical protein